MAASGSVGAVPEGFYFETKYVLLCYLGLPSRSQSRPAQGASGHAEQETSRTMDKTRRMKEIEEELKLLDEEISAAFSRTGFDRHTSPVFSPANPESSVEDSLAVVGDRVADELDAYLTAAIQTLLSGQLEYEDFKKAVQEVSLHSQGGWSKVLVPLVMLQSLQDEGRPLSSLLAVGERYLHETEADFIIQQGGWSAVFSLDDVEDPGLLIAEDSNDIYILTGEQGREHLSPPESLLISVADSSGTSSWQAESLPVSLSGHESWAQVGHMEPEDAKSVDSGEGAVSAEERSENNSSNSDIVHVEHDEAEILEEGGEAVEGGDLQESVLSMLGSESELEALRREPQLQDAPELLVSLEEPVVILEAPVLVGAVDSSVIVDLKSMACPSTDVPSSFTVIASPVPDPKPELQTTQSEPVLAPVEPQLKPITPMQGAEPKTHEPVYATSVPEILLQAEAGGAITAQESPSLPPDVETLAQEPQIVLGRDPLLSTSSSQGQETLPQEPRPVQAACDPAATSGHPEPVNESASSSSSDISTMLCGGAALAAIVALVAYGALAYRKK